MLWRLLWRFKGVEGTIEGCKVMWRHGGCYGGVKGAMEMWECCESEG